MKFVMKFVFLLPVFLIFIIAERAGAEICFSTSLKETDLRDLRSHIKYERDHHARMSYSNDEDTKLSPQGYLLFAGKYKKDPVTLVDLETGGRTEFLPSVYSAGISSFFTGVNTLNIERLWRHLRRPTKSKKERFYGFSKSGAFAYALLSDGRFKLKSLPHNEEWIFPVTKEGEALTTAFHEETHSLTLLEIPAQTADKIRNFSLIDDEMTESAVSAPPVSFMESAFSKFRAEDLILRRIDLKTGEEERKVIPKGIKELLCGFISSDKRNIFFVDEDGALYQRPFATTIYEDPVESPKENGAFQLFGAVEGFRLGRDLKEIKQRCAFLPEQGLNVLKAPDGTGYILRHLKNRLEFFMPYEWFYSTPEERGNSTMRRRITDFFNYIKYPFVFSPAGGRWHIPSRHYHSSSLNYGWNRMITDQLLSGRVFPEYKKELYPSSRIVFHPAAGKPRTLFNVSFPCEFFEKNNRVFIFSRRGDLFVVDVSNGDFSRHWLGGSATPCLNLHGPTLSVPEITPDGSGLSLLTVRSDPASQISFSSALNFQRVCFDPLPPPADIKSLLLNMAEAEQPFLKERLSLFTSVLNLEKTIQDHPEELTKALWNILRRSPILYIEIYRRYPSLAGLPGVMEDGGLNLKDAEQTTAAVREILKMLLSDPNRYSELADWNLLNPLRPVLKTLPPTERDFYIEDITLSIVRTAIKRSSQRLSYPNSLLEIHHADKFASIYPSKLYYLINGHIKELFGLEREPYSDVTVYRKQSWSRYFGGKSDEKTYNIALALLSSDPIEIEGHTSVLSPYGFHYAVLKTVSGPTAELKKGDRLMDETVEWKMQGRARRAEALVDVGMKHGQDVNDLIPALPGPDYESLWRDQRLTGVVTVSANLRDYTRYTADQYMDYLKSRGFEFSTHYVKDFKETVLKWITNCKADWLMYQGHAGGDERNIFQIDKYSYLIRAFRLKDKKRRPLPAGGGSALAEKSTRPPAYEEIFLVLPRSRKEKEEETEKSVSDFLSVNEFKNAMDARDKNKCGQIIYFNTTCWSANKAIAELGAVASPSLVNIPTFSPSEAFRNDKDGALRALIQSLREGRDFAGFRSALSANKEYRDNLRNRYIFPDEKVYREEIVDRVQLPLDIEIDLWEKRDGEYRRLPSALPEPDRMN